MNHQIASRGSPLKGVKVVEFEGIGPGPLAGMLLTQLGAEVTVVARPGPGDLPKDLTPREDGLLSRDKRRVVLNLKQEDDRTRALEIVAASDGLIEGNRPGVMERLGVGVARGQGEWAGLRGGWRHRGRAGDVVPAGANHQRLWRF